MTGVLIREAGDIDVGRGHVKMEAERGGRWPCQVLQEPPAAGRGRKDPPQQP